MGVSWTKQGRGNAEGSQAEWYPGSRECAELLREAGEAGGLETGARVRLRFSTGREKQELGKCWILTHQ